ncbi:hypothetical protein AMJ80_07250, partial [bacterium SM23_31]
MKYLIIGIVISVFSCSAPVFVQKEQIPVIKNTEPRSGNAPYAEFKLLHTIPTYDDKEEYGISMIYDFAVDNNDNLYVVSGLDNNITVFDSNGKYVRTIGREGEDPGEFRSPVSIAIKGNEMHVFQKGGSFLQVLDLRGKYKRKSKPVDNVSFRFINFYGDYYLTFNRKRQIKPAPGSIVISNAVNRQLYCTVEMRDKDFDLVRDIVYVREKDPKEDRFSAQHDAILSGSNIDKYIYFPQNTDKYEITKYDLKGNALLTFTRQYKQELFSKPVKDYLKRLNEWWINYYNSRGTPKNMRNPYFVDPSEHPCVIRKILIDDKQNIWVLAGEWALDADFEVTVESTLDIFDPDGIYL